MIMMSKEEKEFIKRIEKYPSKHTSRDKIVAEYLNYPPDYDRRYYILQKTVSNMMYDMGLEEFRDYVIKLTSRWYIGALERRDINLKRIYALRIPNNEEVKL